MKHEEGTQRTDLTPQCVGFTLNTAFFHGGSYPGIGWIKTHVIMVRRHWLPV
jgi:hypothetical protein